MQRVATGTWTESISILTNVVDAGPDQVIEQGDSTMLLASERGHSAGARMARFSCVDCSHPVASPQTTTTYTLSHQQIQMAVLLVIR